MNATEKIDPEVKLQLAFDVGHSSIGWAVLERIGTQVTDVKIHGCGAVTFGANDCLASKRRGYRRQRRHTRATRQRIERMAKLFLCLLTNDSGKDVADLRRELRLYLTSLKRAELTLSGTKKNESHPWLLAARVLSARSNEEKAKARLNWSQLWGVLRWYAHNRGYDGNIRWSGGFRIEAFSETPLAGRKEVDAQAETLKDEDPEDDKKKLQAAAARMDDYGFTTPTFAETVAKFLLGPDRTVKAGGEGKPGIVEPTTEEFTQEEFKRLLFNCEPGFENHPRHLRNYFKGIRAAFPRRVIKDIDGRPTLVGGTEWEVRYILRAHFNYLECCNPDLERALCGGMPESTSDWAALKAGFPQLYLSDGEQTTLRGLRGPKILGMEHRRQIIQKRKEILTGKLALPARYHGGLLFGQLVPRFDNRIIEQCPFTFASINRAILDKDEKPLKAFKLTIAQIMASRRHVKGEWESDATLAQRWAAKLAKVPSKNCLEFLDYRWAMIIANLRIGFEGQTHRNADGKETNLRPLNPDERLKIDAEGRKRGFFIVEPDKAGKDGIMRVGKNELREIVIAQTGCTRHNLDSLLLVPDIKEALRIMPVKGSKASFQIAWGAFGPPKHDRETGVYQDDPLRRRFARELLRGKKDDPRFLTIARIITQLQSPEVIKKHPTAAEIVGRLEQATRKEASDKRGNLNEAKLAELMHAKFSCERLKGRARFGRHKLREAVQQVMHKDSPLHPLEKNGCLEQTDAIKQASLQKSLPDLTNNHLVRHRLLILAGDQQASAGKIRKEGLLDHIIQEFAGGHKKCISRITIELARDLQTMSGMTNKAKAQELSARHDHHDKVSEELAKKLASVTDSKGRPVEITAGLIRKARIADDLDWICPYTRQIIEPADLVRFNTRHLTNHAVQKDHVIPRTKRLSDALEAQVITFAEVNFMKENRTALQFVKEFGGNPVIGLHNLYVRTEAQFREFVNNLWPPEALIKRARAEGRRLTDDEARCWRRKQLMLTEKWEEKEFTPADLTKTRHLVKLAAQQLERAFHDFPIEQRPPIICITGAVTAAFRDKTWKLIRELAAVHSEVKSAADEEQVAKKAGQDYNLKKKIRGITSLHHAVDAIALGLVTDLLVPPGHGSLNNELARLIIKAKLTAEEMKQFEALRHQLRLPKFYQWAVERCEGQRQIQTAANHRSILCLNELSKSLKKEIQLRLKECRVAQHIPADQGTLDVDETLYRVFDPKDKHPTSQKLARWFELLIASGEIKKIKKLPDPNAPSDSLVLLVSRKRRGSGEKAAGKILHDTGRQWFWQYLLVSKDAVHGLLRNGEFGKLASLKAAKPLGKNFGVIKITKKGQKPVFNTIRPCKAYAQLKVFRQENPDAQIELIRRGTLIDLTEDDGSITRLRIFGSGERPGRGIYFDSAPPDALERVREIQISAFKDGRAKILKSPLTGIPACPTTSSA
jgi:hypothetical protein